jgi:hypothetical protein
MLLRPSIVHPSCSQILPLVRTLRLQTIYSLCDHHCTLAMMWLCPVRTFVALSKYVGTLVGGTWCVVCVESVQVSKGDDGG